ncbi:MAG: hypothetical protein K6U10_01355 [Acidobacteriia bacterium]|nr:hypothetical protein [Methyloceanibacter sp.]MCL6490448.1 hypothetical protein [Terriglobia bacterium]
MSWLLYRWVWQLEAPLSIGMPPAGTLNRCRLYVPARAVWGAMTAELARNDSNDFPKYTELGEKLRKQARLTYLFPAGLSEDRFVPWLPIFKRGNGLVWQRETRGCMPDRVFRSWLLDTRPGTAIDPTADAAAEGSLRETECIGPFWRPAANEQPSPVGLVGYVFCRSEEIAREISKIDLLFLGGDTRYGLGRVRRVNWSEASDVFGTKPILEANTPCISSGVVFAHALRNNSDNTMVGALECLAGWDRTGTDGLAELDHKPLWIPGSTISNGAKAEWEISESGFWHYPPQSP